MCAMVSAVQRGRNLVDQGGEAGETPAPDMSCYVRAYTAAIEQVGRGLTHRHIQPGLFAAVGKTGGIIVILHDLEGAAIIQGAHL